ncbi:MAG: universal stress protein, partial [Candidatus Tectimicrobiota bacterium]
MFKTIYVPVDNSEHSNAAVALSIHLAKAFGATVVGSHVYAARLHDYRFRQMEFTLPEAYQQEAELERQRQVHDSLIAMGLKLISDSYLDVLIDQCRAAGVPVETKTFDGRNFERLATDINANNYDLVVMGALGMGAVKESALGGVVERVVRRTQTDTWVVKQPGSNGAGDTPGPILVGIDGSPQAFGGLMVALALAKRFGHAVEAVGVFDPYLHYHVFHRIKDVLSDEAAAVFRFQEQEQLHEQIIDTGLARIYQSHLEIARKMAADHDVDLKITLLDGKAFEKILQYARTVDPALLVLGRIGIHSDETMDIGATTENLLRQAPCDVLVVSRQVFPSLEMQAEEAITWTEEAEARLGNVPPVVRGVARMSILRYAIERGYTVITSSLIDDCLKSVMPPSAMKAMGEVLKTLAVERIEAAGEPTFICTACGHAARGLLPTRCPVCQQGSGAFQKIDKSILTQRAHKEGGHEAQEAFDGVTVVWTQEARRAMEAVEPPHVRDPLDVKRYMALVILALVPSLLAARYFFGLRVLAMIVVSYVAG